MIVRINLVKLSFFHWNFNFFFPTVVKDAYEWLITWLVIETQRKHDEELTKGANNFTARNKSQVYRAALLSRAYGEVNCFLYQKIKRCKNFNFFLFFLYSQRTVLDLCVVRLNNLIPLVSETKNLRIVLDKLILLYGLNCIEKHLTTFYQGKFITLGFLLS